LDSSRVEPRIQPRIQSQLRRIDSGWKGSRGSVGQVRLFPELSLTQSHATFPFQLLRFQLCLAPGRRCHVTINLVFDASRARSHTGCVVDHIRWFAPLFAGLASKTPCQPLELFGLINFPCLTFFLPPILLGAVGSRLLHCSRCVRSGAGKNGLLRSLFEMVSGQ
jgi:hypothetical protein